MPKKLDLVHSMWKLLQDLSHNLNTSIRRRIIDKNELHLP